MVSASPFVGNLLSKLFRFRNRAQMPNFISGAIRKGDAIFRGSKVIKVFTFTAGRYRNTIS